MPSGRRPIMKLKLVWLSIKRYERKNKNLWQMVQVYSQYFFVFIMLFFRCLIRIISCLIFCPNYFFKDPPQSFFLQNLKKIKFGSLEVHWSVHRLACKQMSKENKFELKNICYLLLLLIVHASELLCCMKMHDRAVT